MLTYHVAAGAVISDMLSDNMMIEMINGAEATITFSGGSIFIDDAEIIIADLIAENGVVPSSTRSSCRPSRVAPTWSPATTIPSRIRTMGPVSTRAVRMFG